METNSSSIIYTRQLDNLISSCMEVNLKLWKLEDEARMKNKGFKSIAIAKGEIDQNNHIRNEIIQNLDMQIEHMLNNNSLGTHEKYQAESPGMLIDRIAILFIKQMKIWKLTIVISDENLKAEYLEKWKIVTQQISDSGKFLDYYLDKIKNGTAFFKIYRPMKIYNDERIKKYLQSL